MSLFSRGKCQRLLAQLLLFSSLSFALAEQVDADPSGIPEISGLWGGEQNVPPAVSGMLKIRKAGNEWKAVVGGTTVSVDRQGQRIQFSMPNSQGRFRGEVSDRDAKITGYWIQPLGIFHDYQFASPVQFSRSGFTWTGNIKPLPDRCRLFLIFQSQPDGSLRATVRNPEAGWFSRETYQVEIHEDRIQLKGESRSFEAKYERSTDTLIVVLPNHPLSRLVLKRQEPSTAIGLYPRAGDGSDKYSYQKPAATGDDWSTANLDEVGIELEPISRLMRGILSSDPVDPHNVPIHSILIARHGRLALEEYFYGFQRDQTHDMRSASKSFAPVLVDLARRRGFGVKPETAVYSLFDADKRSANWDPRKDRMTVENLMDMTSGLACDDNDNSSPGNEDRLWSQSNEPDFYKYILDLPLARDPGDHTAVYCSGSPNLVGGVAQRVSHIWLGDLFTGLAYPLHFGTYYLNLTPNDDVYMGGGAYLRPRDELKFGQIYLSKGLWKGRRVIDADWVDRTSSPHSTFFRKVDDIETQHDYGYNVHIHTIVSNGKSYKEFGAEGNGGQVVMVVPELDLVVAINGGAYGRSSDWSPWMLRALSDFIIPAAHN